MKRRIALFLSAAAALLLAACTQQAGGIAETGSSTLAVVGRTVPAWTAPTSTGTALSIDALRGKAIYLNFFASWCPPCNEEAPDINALQKEYGARGLQVVGVDIMENAAKAQQFVAMHHLVYPAIVDSGMLRTQYRVNGLPVHVFIDRAGIVRRIEIGELSKAEMTSAIKAIL